MDDEFLYLLREEPNPDFGKRLHERLCGSDHFRQRLPLDAARDAAPANRKTRFVSAAGLLVVLLIAALAISPVGALILSYPIEVAGRIFEISSDYPDGEPVEIIEPQIMSLSEALAVFPYPVNLPKDIPAEYVLDEQNVRLYTGLGNWPETIVINWTGDGKGLSLSICGDCDGGQIIAPGSVEDVMLDDQHPAALIRGGWFENETAWNYEIALTLEWKVGDALYTLSTGTMLPGHLSQGELIEIAASTLK